MLLLTRGGRLNRTFNLLNTLIFILTILYIHPILYIPPMPKVTVYIRKEDYQAWKLVDQKTEFIHNALHQNMPRKPNPIDIPAVAKIFPEVVRVRKAEARKPATCKHGYAIGFCKYGCKK